jgi:hypothetical protein
MTGSNLFSSAFLASQVGASATVVQTGITSSNLFSSAFLASQVGALATVPKIRLNCKF